MGQKNILLKAIPEEATTQVWMTVFSCLVNGCPKSPSFWATAVQVFKIANPNKPAATFSDGITPVVKLSLQTIKLKTMLRKKLANIALKVTCFCHGGTSITLKIPSIVCCCCSASTISAEEDLLLPIRV